MSLLQRLSCIGEMEGFGKLDIEPVQMAAVETIIDYCKRQADEWKDAQRIWRKCYEVDTGKHDTD